MHCFIANSFAAVQLPRKVKLNVDFASFRKVSTRHHEAQHSPGHELAYINDIYIPSLITAAILQFYYVADLRACHSRIIVLGVVNRPPRIIVDLKTRTLRRVSLIRGLCYKFFESYINTRAIFIDLLSLRRHNVAGKYQSAANATKYEPSLESSFFHGWKFFGGFRP